LSYSHVLSGQQDFGVMLAESGPAADNPVRLRFGEFVLDSARGGLFGADGAQVALRPKTWSLLLHLAAHPGQVVSREALLDAVWPDVTVTDDSITQCVAELRRALGEDGARWLRTVPRRGYVFDAPVAADAPAEPPVPAVAPVMGPPVAPVLPAWTSGRRLGLAAVAVAGLALGIAVWPRHTPPPAPSAVPPVPAQSAAEVARDTASRLFREGLAMLDLVADGGGQWLAAREKFLGAIAVDPGFAPAYAQAIFTHTNMVVNGFAVNPESEIRAAEQLLERLASLRPDAAFTHNARGAVLRVQGRHAEALAAYRRVGELDPGLLPPRANVGLMLILLGRAEEAIAPIRATIALAPASHAFQVTWQAYLGVALLHAQAEDFGVEALRLARGDQALLPGAGRELHLIAALALNGDLDEASAALAALRARDPGVSQARLRAAPLSVNPDYLAQREALFRGLDRAGLR
jgi:DNA-binding winged helix-turn-helix (wHTH) protein/tetratricopeptide (TPR) repeat protein